MYKINKLGFQTIEKIKKNQIINFFLSIILCFFFTLLSSYRFASDIGIVIFFYVLSSFLCLVLGIIIPINTIYFLANTIYKIEFRENYCLIYTSKSLFVKQKTIKLNYSSISVVKCNFTTYPKPNNQGITITDKLSNQKYKVVESFFDDYNKFLIELKMKSLQ